MKKQNLIELSMKYRQVIISIVLVMMIIGGFSLATMPRNEFPHFTIRQGLVIGVYPGATSLEVEQQLTKDVENYLFGYKEINKEKTYSQSREGMMIVFVELNDDVENSDQFWSKLRHGLEELKMKLPSGVLALFGTNDFGDTSALLVTMSSESKDYRELEDSMEELETEIRKLESVSKIKKYGEQKEKIFIYTKPEKLNEYSVNPTSILASFKIQDALNYAGMLDNNVLTMPVHLPPRFESVKDLEEQIVYSDPMGNVIRLKDIARVERKYDKPDSYIRNNKKNALLLSLEMQPGRNIVEFSEEVETILDNFSSKYSGKIDLNIISNQGEVVDNSISHFLKEFLIAVLAVIIVTMILLPFRIASVAAVTIPITIMITLGIMQMVGIQLDTVSLAGLIVVLGMVVDNAIVIIDNHVEKLDHGDSPWDAAWKAATDLYIPVLSATAAICAAFFPLMMFLVGMAGDFVGSFPLTIGIALGISLIIAILLVPVICFIFIKKGLHDSSKTKNKKSFLDIVQEKYDKILDIAFRWPKTTIFSGVLSVLIAIIMFKNIDMQVFPSMDRMQFAVEVYLPEGYSLEQTETVIDSLENILMDDKRITNVASFVGSGSPRFHDLYAPHMPAKNYGQILVNTVSNNATVEVLDEYSQKYRDIFPQAHIKWKQIAMESFPAPIEIRISGDNIREIKEVASEVSGILDRNEKTTWIRTDWLEKRRGIQVELDRDKANRMGYTKTFVSTSLMTALSGLPVTTVWEGDYPVEVVLSNEEEFKNDIKDVENQYVVSPFTMESLPLRSVATLHPEWTEGQIVRRNGVRTITVQADIERAVIYSKVFNEVHEAIESIKLPEGVNIVYGGEKEMGLEVFVPMGKALATSIVLIFFILLFQFKTIRRSLLIMSTMLLSLFGVSLGLLIVGYPFGVTSFIGLIGLMGITVRNGIILVDYAMQLVEKDGMSFMEAGIAAGRRRMRPIFLTSMAAAIGVVPMIISNSPLWGPLGAVICFGLIFGMLQTLFVVPVLYWKTTSQKEIEPENVSI